MNNNQENNKENNSQPVGGTDYKAEESSQRGTCDKSNPKFTRNGCNIMLLVATHKVYWMPEDDLYLPVHAGKINKESIGYIGDDTGDNISLKNRNYCELSCMYWAWKNLDKNVSHVGLAHYRRHFSIKNKFQILLGSKKDMVLTKNQAKKLVAEYDLILPKKRNYFIETNQSHYNHAHNEKDLLKTREIILSDFPEYINAFDTVMERTSAHMFNMFIMKRELFNNYCSWLFFILEKLEKQIDISKYNNYESRVFGYISELLMDVYVEQNNLSYKEISFMFMDKQNWFKKISDFLKRKFTGGPFSK